MSKSKKGVLHAILREMEPGVFRAEYPGEMNQDEATVEAFPNSPCRHRCMGVRQWVETMATSLESHPRRMGSRRYAIGGMEFSVTRSEEPATATAVGSTGSLGDASAIGQHDDVSHLPARREHSDAGGVAGLAALLLGGVIWWWAWPRMDYVRHRSWTVEQPVPFSHQHHVAGLGIDCRFCHVTVETAGNAGMPPT